MRKSGAWWLSRTNTPVAGRTTSIGRRRWGCIAGKGYMPVGGNAIRPILAEVWRFRPLRPSGQQLLDHVPVYVREPAVDAVVTHRQPLVVDPQEVQDGRVDVVHLRRLLAVLRL